MKTQSVFALGEPVTALGAKTLRLDVYDLIGDQRSFDAVTVKNITYRLDQNSDASEINVRINSLGGAVDQAQAISAKLRSHPAKVVVDVDGVAASAATIVMSAGDVVRVGRGNAVMIHEGSVRGEGKEGDHLALAEWLHVVNEGLADTYFAMAQKRGKPTTREQFRAWMAQEKWFSAQEAVDAGLADEVVDVVSDPVQASLDLTQCNAIPGWVAQRFGERFSPSAAAGSATGQRTEPAQEPEMKNLLFALGLPQDAQETAAVTAVSSMREQRDSAQALLSKIEMQLGASGTNALLAISALKDSAEKLGSVTAQLQQTQEKLAEQEKVAAEVERSAIVKALDSEGKIAGPDMLEWVNNMSVADLKAFAKVAKPLVPGSKDTINHREADPTALALTDREKREAAELGLTEAQYLEGKKSYLATIGAVR